MAISGAKKSKLNVSNTRFGSMNATAVSDGGTGGGYHVPEAEEIDLESDAAEVQENETAGVQENNNANNMPAENNYFLNNIPEFEWIPGGYQGNDKVAKDVQEFINNGGPFRVLAAKWIETYASSLDVLEEEYYNMPRIVEEYIGFNPETLTFINETERKEFQDYFTAQIMEEMLFGSEYSSWDSTNAFANISEYRIGYIYIDKDGNKHYALPNTDINTLRGEGCTEILELHYGDIFDMNDDVLNEYIDSIDDWQNMNNTKMQSIYDKLSIHANDTFKEYNAKCRELEKDICTLKSAKYEIEQQQKQLPYLLLAETKEYQNFINNNENAKHVDDDYFINSTLLGTFLTGLGGGTDEYVEKWNCLTIEQKQMLLYQYETNGREGVLDYFNAYEDYINKVLGYQEATEFIKSISDANGNIDYNAWNYIRASGKGLADGLETWGEGIANVFATEAMMSQNQWAQMFLLQYLANDEQKHGKDFYLDDTYQISSSIGNMLPSIIISIVAGEFAGAFLAEAGSAAGAAVTAGEIGKTAGQIAMGLSVFGNSKMQALQSGNNLLASTLYGAFSAMSEVCLEKVLGNIPGLSDVSELTLEGIFKEGLEEYVQEWVSAGLGAVFLGEEINLTEVEANARKSFIYGAITSGVMNGGQVALNIVINGTHVTFTKVEQLIEYYKLLNNGNNEITDVLAITQGSSNTDAQIDTEINEADAAEVNNNGTFEDPTVDITQFEILDEVANSDSITEVDINAINELASKYNLDSDNASKLYGLLQNDPSLDVDSLLASLRSYNRLGEINEANLINLVFQSIESGFSPSSIIDYLNAVISDNNWWYTNSGKIEQFENDDFIQLVALQQNCDISTAKEIWDDIKERGEVSDFKARIDQDLLNRLAEAKINSQLEDLTKTISTMKSLADQGYYTMSLDDILALKIQGKTIYDINAKQSFINGHKRSFKGANGVDYTSCFPTMYDYISDYGAVNYTLSLLDSATKSQIASELGMSVDNLSNLSIEQLGAYLLTHNVTVKMVTFQNAATGKNNYVRYEGDFGGRFAGSDIAGAFAFPIGQLETLAQEYPDILSYDSATGKIEIYDMTEFGKEVLGGVPLSSEGTYMGVQEVTLNNETSMPSVVNGSSYLVNNVPGGFLPSGSPELVLPGVKISGFVKGKTDHYTGQYQINDYTSNYDIDTIKETQT